MGYNLSSLNYITSLLSLSKQQSGRAISLLDLGAQEVGADVTCSALLRCIKTLSPNFDREANLISQVPALKASAVFKAADVEYFAVDLYESEDTLIWDLNTCDVPERFHNHFDLVTNAGTTEHVFNQFNAFRTIHDAVKVGGIMSHFVPSTGYYNHGLFKYEPRFFWLLAIANGYEVVDWGLSPPEKHYWVPPSIHTLGSDLWQNVPMPGMILRFTMRKLQNISFVQPTDVDQRFLPSSFGKEAREGIAQSPVALENPHDSDIQYGKPTALPALVYPPFENDLDKLEKCCASYNLGAEPIMLAAAIRKKDASLLASQTYVSVAELEAIVVSAAKSVDGVPEIANNTLTPAIGILGFGWQEAFYTHGTVFNSWRWFSGDCPATIYCRLPAKVDSGAFTLKVVFHDARPGDTINYFCLFLNGDSVKGKNENNPPGTYFWQSEVLPKINSDIIQLELRCDLKGKDARLAISSIQFISL